MMKKLDIALLIFEVALMAFGGAFIILLLTNRLVVVAG